MFTRTANLVLSTAAVAIAFVWCSAPAEAAFLSAGLGDSQSTALTQASSGMSASADIQGDELQSVADFYRDLLARLRGRSGSSEPSGVDFTPAMGGGSGSMGPATGAGGSSVSAAANLAEPLSVGGQPLQWLVCIQDSGHARFFVSRLFRPPRS